MYSILKNHVPARISTYSVRNKDRSTRTRSFLPWRIVGRAPITTFCPWNVDVSPRRTYPRAEEKVVRGPTTTRKCIYADVHRGLSFFQVKYIDVRTGRCFSGFYRLLFVRVYPSSNLERRTDPGRHPSFASDRRLFARAQASMAENIPLLGGDEPCLGENDRMFRWARAACTSKPEVIAEVRQLFPQITTRAFDRQSSHQLYPADRCYFRAVVALLC